MTTANVADVTDADAQKLDAGLIALFNDRDGLATTVRLVDGRTLIVWNIAWGYDMDDEYAHITTNCSPFVDDLPLESFTTDKVIEVRTPDTGLVLFARDR